MKIDTNRMNIDKAIIPVAGLGKRFLPISRTIPKAMIPLLDRPILDYAIFEAIEAGISEIFIVMSRSQNLIIEYFESDPDLPYQPKQTRIYKNIEKTIFIQDSIQLNFIIQEKPLGLGHAILLAKESIGDNPFSVLLPDDMIFSEKPTTLSMINFFKNSNSNLIAVRKVSNKFVPMFGIVEIECENQPMKNFCMVKSMIEKPELSKAPSNLAIAGRYLLLPSIFDSLDKTSLGVNNEIQLTDGISSLISTHQTYAFLFGGAHFDVGTPEGLLQASNYLTNIDIIRACRKKE